MRATAGCQGETPNAWRDSVHIESYNNIYDTTPDRWARTIRTHDWRYTIYPCGSGEHLFSLRDDRDETVNLVSDPACAGVRRAMRDRLLEALMLRDYPHPRRSLHQLGVQ